MSRLFLEAWTRPGDPNFGRIYDYLPTQSYGFNDGVNRIGGGDAKIARSFAGFADLLSLDRSNLANSKSSLIRVYSERDPDNPIMEWLPASRVPAQSKDDPNVEMVGEGIKSILRYARTEAWDWDGTDDFTPTFADWVYGGPNILSNPGFEDNQIVPNKWELYTEASAGTFTLSDGTDTTSAIAFNAAPATVETRLQTDIAAIVDVLVTGAGTEADPWVIEFVDPGVGVTLTANGGGLTPANSETLTETQPGQNLPAVWTKSQQVSFGVPKVFGRYASDGFRLTEGAEPVLAGNFALRVNGLSQFAGAQQVINVKPGGIYQVAAPVFTSSAVDEFRLVIRTINGGFVGSDTGGLDNTPSGSPGAWDTTTFTITDLQIPDNVTQVIVRFAYVGTGNPVPFYLDQMVFAEGLAATTIGKILGDLYDDATANHAPDRIVWEREAVPGTIYLTKDFTDALDSAGNPWDRDDREMRITMRMDLGMVMDRAASDWDYEYRIVPDDPEAGTWLWQVYNPGTMSVDHTTAARPAVQGGSDDVEASLRTFAPDGTDIMVEGLARITSRSRSAALMSAFGRIEASRLDRELPSVAGIRSAAITERSNIVPTMLDYVYEFTGDMQDEPLSDYALGDELTIHDPPEVQDTGRFIDVTVTVNPDETRFECHYLPNAEDVSS